MAVSLTIKKKWRIGWESVRDAAIAFVRNGTWRMAAAIAFYALFSIGPLLLVVLQVTGLFMQEGNTREMILEQIHLLVGDKGAGAVEKLLENYSFPTSGWIGYLIGGWTLLFGGVNMLAQIRDAMHRIWPDKVTDEHARPVWLNAAIQIGGVIAFGFMMILSLGVSSILAYASSSVESETTFLFQLLTMVGNLLFIIVVTGVVVLLFRYLPSARIRWPSLAAGAVLTSILFMIESRLLILWFGHSGGGASAFGSISWLIVFLIWAYVAAQVLLYGATFTGVLDGKLQKQKKD